MTPLTSILDSPILSWSQLISLSRTTTSLSLRASPLGYSPQQPFFTTAIRAREFQVLSLGVLAHRLLGPSARQDLSGTSNSLLHYINITHKYVFTHTMLFKIWLKSKFDHFVGVWTSWNLTASGPRPNPQGSYHYGLIKPARTIMLANSAPYINGKQRFAVNSVSYVQPDTPLKLVDYFKIPGVFSVGSIPTNPTGGSGYLQTSVMHANFREYVEIVFQNWEDTVQSWHIDGYSFFVMG